VQRGVDVLILGCTHYTPLRSLIGRIMGGATLLIDSSEKCAEDVARRLQATGLLRGGGGGSRHDDGALRCFLTDDAPRFRTLAKRFLGAEVDPPTLVTTDELHGGAVGAVLQSLRASA